jgi:acyl-CoA dehydrogenase
MHDVRAFLDPAHLELSMGWNASVAGVVGEAHPCDDAEGRLRAVEMCRDLGSAGWFNSIVDGDWRACCMAREILGYHSPLADAVFALQGLSATPLGLTENAVQRERWLPRLASGEVVGGFAMTEPEAGSDVSALQTRAHRTEDGWVLNGEKTFISNAGIAGVYVVFASTDPDAGTRGISTFLIPADTPGLEFAGAQVMSAPHPLGRIRFEDCRVEGDALISAEGSGFKLGMMTLDRLRPTVGAAACGMAARALDEAVTHARTRVQFGKPLAELQLIQQKIARMATELTAARMLVYRAAWEKDSGADRITLEAAMAKSYATEAAQRIIDDAIQVLGGRGVMADHPVDHLYRSVRSLRIYEGATEVQSLIIAGQIVGRAAARAEADAGRGDIE